MTTLQKRRLKRKLRKFWKEWGITKQELCLLFCAICLIMFPVLIRFFFAFFGI